MTATLMIQGTASNVGKSLLVAGLCRAFVRRGLTVRPFKPQTLSNNAAATAKGGEIGRAQALQAQACGAQPSVHMNPVLLKPEDGGRMQVIVQGQKASIDAASPRHSLMPRVLDSFARVCTGADLVLIEGAGAASEINLRLGDIANMGFARAAGVPVVLAGDIECGGVIAQIVGTQAVLDPGDAAMIRGFVINRFHGDPGLFAAGLAAIEQRTGWPALGVVPWFAGACRLPAEDVADLRHTLGRAQGDGPFRVIVPCLPHIANFDDLDPLRADPGLRVELVAPGHPLPVEADLIVLPGSKATRADLAAFRTEGWDIDLAAARRRGAWVLGLCGGYQMLGRSIADPGGVEGEAGTVAGLGVLSIDTVMQGDKRVTPVQARHIASGTDVQAYEIHTGCSDGPDRARPLFTVDGQPEGAISADGRAMGSYLHGIFAADAFRRAFLTSLGAEASAVRYAERVDETLNALADHLEAHLDCTALLDLARSGFRAGEPQGPE